MARNKEDVRKIVGEIELMAHDCFKDRFVGIDTSLTHGDSGKMYDYKVKLCSMNSKEFEEFERRIKRMFVLEDNTIVVTTEKESGNIVLLFHV